MSRFLRFASEGEELSPSPKPNKQEFQSPPRQSQQDDGESIFSRPLFMGRTPVGGGNMSTPPKSQAKGYSSPDGTGARMSSHHMAKFSGVERSHRRQLFDTNEDVFVKEFDDTQLNYDTYMSQVVNAAQNITQSNARMLLIETQSQLQQMVQAIQGHMTLYVNWKLSIGDSIHSSFICWLLIGTQDGSLYVIDTLKLRSTLRGPKGLGRILEKAFLSNQQVLKVLPKDLDVISTQRDFSIKLCNLLPLNLGQYLNQQAIDWRERPLTDYAIQVIQSEYQSLQMSATQLPRQMIILPQCFNTNISLSKTKYFKNLVQCENISEAEQILCKWRDEIVQMDNEMDEFVLPQAFITFLSKAQIQTSQDLMFQARSYFCGYIPQYVEQYKEKLVFLLKTQSVSQQSAFFLKTPVKSSIFLSPAPTPPQNQANQPQQPTSLAKPPRAVYSQSNQKQQSNNETDIFTSLQWIVLPPQSQDDGDLLRSTELQYQDIITQKAFSPSFFEEVDKKTQVNEEQSLFCNPNLAQCQQEDQDVDDSSSCSSSSTSSFKLNREPCLNIFNSILQLNGGHINQLTSPERRSYIQSLSKLNLKDTIENLQQPSKFYSREEPLVEAKPPQSLQDIFKISNRNRKKNKQKKKVCKFDSGVLGDNMSTNSSENYGPVDNVNQIIALQYKIDQQESRPSNSVTLQQIKQLDDYEFMNAIGWTGHIDEVQDHAVESKDRQYGYTSQSHYRDNSGGSYGSGNGANTPIYHKKTYPQAQPQLQKNYSGNSYSGSQTPTYPNSSSQYQLAKSTSYAPQTTYSHKKSSPYAGGQYRNSGNSQGQQQFSSSKQLTYSSPQPNKEPYSGFIQRQTGGGSYQGSRK